VFVVKVENLRYVNELNDISIEFVCYLTCDDGAVYKNTDGSFKYFTIRIPKSTEEWTEQKIIDEALGVLYNDFQINGLITDPTYSDITEPAGIDGTNTLRFSETDVKKLCVGMTLVGPGYTNRGSHDVVAQTVAGSNIIGCINIPYSLGSLVGMGISANGIPSNTTIVSHTSIDYRAVGLEGVGLTSVSSLTLSNAVLETHTSGTSAIIYEIGDLAKHPVILSLANKQDVIVSRNLYFVFYGCTLNPSTSYELIFVTQDATEITLPEIQDWFVGATISGQGIPMNTSITYANKITNVIYISQKITNSATSTISISRNPNSQYVLIRDNPIISDEDTYKDASVSGFGIPDNTLVLNTNVYNDENEFSPLGNNHLKLSWFVATGTSVQCDSTDNDQLFNFSNMAFSAYVMADGDPEDSWGASNIDFSDLLHVASTVNFSLI